MHFYRYWVLDAIIWKIMTNFVAKKICYFIRNKQIHVDRKKYKDNYRKTSNISRTLVNNNIVDNSDVVGASPVGAAPTTSSFST